MNVPSEDLMERHREPHRRYHTLEHIHACLDELGQVRGLVQGERRALELALWFHDAIYDPQRSDNEAESAALARTALTEGDEPEPVIAEVERLILLTAGHAVEPGDRLGAIMVSIDLAVLGGEPEAYDRYATAIKQEYGFVPEALYQAGRSALLQRFLDAEAIYPDPAFRERYEARARENLSRELAALSA